VKKMLLFAAVALALAAFTCCVGPRGDVYLSFDWTYAPEWYSTDDPWLPDVIYRNVDYLTDEGTWYFEYYHAESGYTRWIWYTLTAHDGALIVFPGEDARFQLFLSAFSDPDFIQWRGVAGEPATGQPDSMAAAAAAPRGSTPTEPRVQTFEQTMTSGRWTLSIRGGLIGPTTP
jgi:hypothetical protein